MTLDVVTGFLGAGKTTFLARYIRWLQARGESYCVIENEFGRAGVDGGLLSREGASVREISGGCICCTLKVTLHNLLRELSGEVERVLLEPSGLFCGDDLTDILESPEIADKTKLGMWVGIVDPSALPYMNAEDIAVLQSELGCAGSVVLSKTQLLEANEIARAREIADFLNPPAACWAEDWRELDDEKWFPALREAGYRFREHERRRFDHTAMFQSATLAPKRVFSMDELKASLEALQGSECGQILRLKGALLGERGGWLVNCTPGSVWFEGDEQACEPMLNAIGRNLNRARIREILEGAR